MSIAGRVIKCALRASKNVELHRRSGKNHDDKAEILDVQCPEPKVLHAQGGFLLALGLPQEDRKLTTRRTSWTPTASQTLIDLRQLHPNPLFRRADSC